MSPVSEVKKGFQAILGPVFRLPLICSDGSQVSAIASVTLSPAVARRSTGGMADTLEARNDAANLT